MDHLANGLVYYVAFLFSTPVHEAAHAWAAKLGGDLTLVADEPPAYLDGRGEGRS
jgi:hypothetical protein